MQKKLSFKERRILSKIKKRKEQIKKLEMEVEKMSKLVIGKNGKLEEANKEEKKEDENVPKENPFEKLEETQMPQAPIPNNVSQQVSPQMIQQQLEEERQMELLRKQQMAQQQQMVQQQQPVQQMPQQQQQMPHIPVTIRMAESEQINANVPQNLIEDFISKLNDAIDTQSSFNLGEQVINGRFVMWYKI